MYVYRLEAGDGSGPYTERNSGELPLWLAERLWEHDTEDFPGMRDILLGSMYETWLKFAVANNVAMKDMYSSCPSDEKLEEWFRDGLLEDLIEAGYVVVKYEVDERYTLSKGLQTFFLRDKAVDRLALSC